MKNFIIIAILMVIVALAFLYIYKAKKSGKKCIGCSERSCCDKCTGCSKKINMEN